MNRRSFALGLGWALLPSFLWAAPLSIQNESLRVTYDDSTQEFSVSILPTGKVFLSSVKLTVSGTASLIHTDSSTFGSGQAIALGDAKGNESMIAVFPGLPFAMVSEIVMNSDRQEEIVNKVPLVSFTPGLDRPAPELKIRGSGGLYGVADYAEASEGGIDAIFEKLMHRQSHPPAGSYEWLAVADPQSRNGVVAGFITQDRATGILTPRYSGEKLTVDARVEYGQLHLKPGQAATTETLALGYFDDVRLGLETWADEVAKNYKIKLPPQLAGFCTWYTESHGGAGDEQSLATLADFVRKNLKPFGMTFLQIDDRWQLGEPVDGGPDKNFTGSNPKGPYPSGMKATVDHLHADGLTAGLWFLPFAGAYQDPWFADKQDLFVKTKEGKPYYTAWGGTCLDMTKPVARDYVRGIVNNIVHDWGFTYLKLDGLYTGLAAQQVYVNSDYNGNDHFGDAVFSNPGVTNIEAFRSGLTLVRSVAGPNVFLLGCNTAQNMRVFGGSFGLVDAMRIGPDNAGATAKDTLNVGPPAIFVNWQTWRGASPVFGSRCYFLNGRVWYNDPDPNYVRSSLSLDEARTEASWTAISGQLYTNSDWIPDLPPERLEIIKRTIAPHGMTARPVDFLENDPPRVWQVIDDKGGTRRDVVALYNWDDAPLKVDLPLARLDLPNAASFAAFDFWSNAFLPPVQETLSVTLPPHACQIIALRPMVDHPFVLSTSRHVTQGMIDLKEENWDPATRTLSGKSQVVAGDPYELRIVNPNGNAAWKIFQAGFGDVHHPDGVTVSTSTDHGLRATINPAQSGIVSWQFVF